MIHLIADKKFLPSRDANNKQTSSPSLNPFSPSPFHQKFHLTPFFPGWNSIRRHNFRPENLLIPSHVARWNFATKIHLLSPSPRRSTEIREASIVFSTPSLTRGGPLLPLKPRGTGLTADRVGRHHHHPPVSTLASAQPRWHFRATRNRTPNAVRDGRRDCSRSIGPSDWRVIPYGHGSLIARSSNVVLALLVRWLKKRGKDEGKREREREMYRCADYVRGCLVGIRFFSFCYGGKLKIWLENLGREFINGE